MHLETISTSKEQELLVKACFIQSHLEDVALDENNHSRSTEQVFTLTTLASHLWYQGKEDSSYSFEQSCLTHAADLQTAYQDLFPKVMVAYQNMFSHLPEGQLHALTQQAIDIAQLSNQPLTKENLNTLAQSAFKNPSLLNERDLLISEQNLSSLSGNLKTSEATQQQSLSSIIVKLDPSFEKTMTQILDLYRQEHKQLIQENQKILVPELER